MCGFPHYQVETGVYSISNSTVSQSRKLYYIAIMELENKKDSDFIKPEISLVRRLFMTTMISGK